MLAAPAVFAQELPPLEVTEKEPSNMDSRLVKMYDAMLAGDDPDGFDSAFPTNTNEQRVQVILVMISKDATVPQGLGIEVETSYENLVQATVPVRNLHAIASDENVDMVKLPSRPVPAMVQPLEDGTMQEGFDSTYLLIPAIVLPAVAISFVWVRKSRK